MFTDILPTYIPVNHVNACEGQKIVMDTLELEL